MTENRKQFMVKKAVFYVILFYYEACYDDS